MKGILQGYLISSVSFSYSHTEPKHLRITVLLYKQQDCSSQGLEEQLLRSVTPETVRMRNMKIKFKYPDTENVWQSPDYRTVFLKFAAIKPWIEGSIRKYAGKYADLEARVEEIGLTTYLTFRDRKPYTYKSDLELGLGHKGMLQIAFSHPIDGRDVTDKLYLLTRDPICFFGKALPGYLKDDEVASRIGKYCSQQLTDKELSPYVAAALEKQLDFIDPKTGQRAEWYAELLSCLQEYRCIRTLLQPEVTWSRSTMTDGFFMPTYKEDVARWEAAGGDDLMK